VGEREAPAVGLLAVGAWVPDGAPLAGRDLRDVDPAVRSGPVGEDAAALVDGQSQQALQPFARDVTDPDERVLTAVSRLRELPDPAGRQLAVDQAAAGQRRHRRRKFARRGNLAWASGVATRVARINAATSRALTTPPRAPARSGRPRRRGTS
jgi:hypothetical protein